MTKQIAGQAASSSSRAWRSAPSSDAPSCIAWDGTTTHVLLEAEVSRRHRGNLRQVGDTEDLTALAESAQALADDASGLTPHASVDLVEDQGGGTRSGAET